MSEMRSRRKVVNQFQIQLSQEYRINHTHIHTCLEMYLGFLDTFCNDPNLDKEIGQFCQWQKDDLKMCVQNDKVNTTVQVLECFLLYSRRLGKTRGMSVLAVFLALLGYRGMWRASYGNQLQEAAMWFRKNPFVMKVTLGQSNNRVEVINSQEISFDTISPGKTQSKGVDFIMLDEECTIVVNSAKYDIYEKLRPSLADSRFKIFVHGSTPELNTVAQINYDLLKNKEFLLETQFVAEHPWYDSTWISQEFIDGERRAHPDDPYYVALQYELKWTVPGGKVFENVITEGDPRYKAFPLGFLADIVPTHGGTDFNGDINQHYLILIAYDDNFVYVLDEIRFTDLEELFNPAYDLIDLECEDGLYNTQFTDKLKNMGLRTQYNMNWSGDGKLDKKMVRVQKLRDRKIIINKQKCPKTWSNLDTCAWNRFKLRTEIVKTKDQHGLDGLIHALHESSGTVHYYRKNVDLRDTFGEGRLNKL